MVPGRRNNNQFPFSLQKSALRKAGAKFGAALLVLLVWADFIRAESKSSNTITLHTRTIQETGANPESLQCQKLSLRECVTTKGCFLDCVGKTPAKGRCEPYKCRAAQGKCEGEYAQWDLTKEKCENLKGCTYQAAFCFCPGPELCTCGGGRRCGVDRVFRG